MLSFAGLTVINLMGRTFMYEIDDPFRVADRLLESVPSQTPVLVDMHGEATSEKIAMGWYLDGRVSAVVGTHTHVPTADQRIFPKGTAFVCDVGMCGPLDSVIGVEVEPVLRKFLTGMPTRFTVAEKSRTVQFNSVLVDIDGNGRARSIERVDREWQTDAQ
jgi:metallophosphoesterase (TIGR00282 family)